MENDSENQISSGELVFPSPDFNENAIYSKDTKITSHQSPHTQRTLSGKIINGSLDSVDSTDSLSSLDSRNYDFVSGYSSSERDFFIGMNEIDNEDNVMKKYLWKFWNPCYKCRNSRNQINLCHYTYRVFICFIFILMIGFVLSYFILKYIIQIEI